MNPIILTAYDGAILGPISRVLGAVLNFIYNFLSDFLHINSIPLAIIIFTCVIYTILLPLTYRQQKFSAVNRIMQPEIQAIQKKYKGRRDQASMMAQQEETKAIYDKYGVSMAGSCIQLAIQLPILYALFYVFRNLPGYVGKVKSIFVDLADGIMTVEAHSEIMTRIFENSNITRTRVDFTTTDMVQMKNFIIDVLYKLSDNDWNFLREEFPSLLSLIDTTQENIRSINYLFVLNLSDTPWNIIKDSWESGQFGILICAVLVPICSYLSQMLNIRLMPTAAPGADQMGQQMKMMNMIMPIFSLVFTFTVPVGLGLYWIVSALYRVVAQIILNRHFMKMDPQKLIDKNKDKAAKKQEKRGKNQERIAAAAQMSTKRTLSEKAGAGTAQREILEKSSEARSQAAPGSLAAKANMVSDYNNRNTNKGSNQNKGKRKKK